MVDADLKSITPLWIRDLGNPLFDNYDFVAPLLCPSQIRRHIDYESGLSSYSCSVRPEDPAAH